MPNLFIENFNWIIQNLNSTIYEARDSSYRIAAELISQAIRENRIDEARKYTKLFDSFVSHYKSISHI